MDRSAGLGGERRDEAGGEAGVGAVADRHDHRLARTGGGDGVAAPDGAIVAAEANAPVAAGVARRLMDVLANLGI